MSGRPSSLPPPLPQVDAPQVDAPQVDAPQVDAPQVDARLPVVSALVAAHEREGRLLRLRRSRWAAPAAKGLLAALAIVGLTAVGLCADPKGKAPTNAAQTMLTEPVPPSVSAEPAPPAAEPSKPTEAPPAPASTGVLADGRIVLNLAGEDELTKLPHVGASRAKAIVTLRQKLGKFRAVTDLLRVKGIGRKTLAKIAPKVVLDAPPEPRPSA